MKGRNPPAEVVAAAHQAIVFRQHFPPPYDPAALSFFGGVPVAPRDFDWPRPRNGGSAKPFAFLLQIDCAAVPPPARLGLLPDQGVLFFFLDLTWAQPDAFRVLYHQPDGARWAPVKPPEDLPPAYGDHAARVWNWPQSLRECPPLLPRWTFDPVAITFSRNDGDAQDDEEDAPPQLWSEATGVAAALRAVQEEDVVSAPFTVKDFVDANGAMQRPFAEYPHDWRAVQICTGLLLDRMRHHVPGTAALRHLSEGERMALVVRIRDEAGAWFARAASQVPFAAVPQPERDQFWAWLEDKTWLVRFVLSDVLTLSIEASLSASPAAAARVPADLARRVQARHALVVRSADRLFVSTPNRMLAPPVDVQGHQWDRAKSHLLLLELSTNEGLGHHFGEGVYQFWITPDDLRARRFDKVELTADAY